MLFQRWRAPALCLPCALGTPCSSHFAPHLASNPLSFVTLFLSPPLSLVLFQRSVRDHFAVDKYLYGLSRDLCFVAW